MKLFLSWSGSESKQLASIFKDWLPNVLQYVEPYMSAKDISLGERWNNNITGELEESVFGLIFVTPSNINAPWINYEAGALAKTLDSKVVPILYHADVTILNQGPLKQFQSAKDLEEASILSLLKSINSSNKDGKLEEVRLEKAFEMWWPDLNETISKIDRDQNNITEENAPTEKELLSVIYTKVVEQERILKREQNSNGNKITVPGKLVEDLQKSYEALRKCQLNLEEGPFPDTFFEEVNEGLIILDKAVKYLARRVANPTKYLEKLEKINVQLI